MTSIVKALYSEVCNLSLKQPQTLSLFIQDRIFKPFFLVNILNAAMDASCSIYNANDAKDTQHAFNLLLLSTSIDLGIVLATDKLRRYIPNPAIADLIAATLSIAKTLHLSSSSFTRAVDRNSCAGFLNKCETSLSRVSILYHVINSAEQALNGENSDPVLPFHLAKTK